MRLRIVALGVGVGLATAVVVMAASGVFWHDEQLPLEDSQSPQMAALYSALLDNGYPPLGSPDAPITLVEFGDYQCHFCNVFFHNTKDDLVRNYIDTGMVKMYFKDYTIIGPDSVVAAHGAHCAQEQDMFWAYHDEVYSNWDGENTGWASLENLEAYAAQAGLDAAAWSSCMDASEYSEVVGASNQDGRNLGLQGTPSFFVIDQSGQVTNIHGAQPYDAFARFFDELLLP